MAKAKAGTVRERLADLQAEVAAAGERYSEAAYRGTKERAEANGELISSLRSFQARDPQKLDPDHADERRRLTTEILSEVEARGLVFEWVLARGGGALALRDPAIDTDLDAALAAKGEAEASLRQFVKDNREAVALEEARERADAFREAVDADDLDTARRLLNGEPERPDTPLTTENFQRERERRSISEGAPADRKKESVG